MGYNFKEHHGILICPPDWRLLLWKYRVSTFSSINAGGHRGSLACRGFIDIIQNMLPLKIWICCPWRPGYRGFKSPFQILQKDQRLLRFLLIWGYYICLVTFGPTLQFLLKSHLLWLISLLFAYLPCLILHQALCTVNFLSLIFMESHSQIVTYFSVL